MVNNVGQEDGEATLSEIHDREVKAFATQMARVEAENTQSIAWAGRSFAVADIYKAIAIALRVATALGTVEAIHLMVKWW